jgi:hypothetical protein
MDHELVAGRAGDAVGCVGRQAPPVPFRRHAGCPQPRRRGSRATVWLRRFGRRSRLPKPNPVAATRTGARWSRSSRSIVTHVQRRTHKRRRYQSQCGLRMRTSSLRGLGQPKVRV